MTHTYSFSEIVKASEMTSVPAHFRLQASQDDLNEIKTRLKLVDIDRFSAKISAAVVKNSDGIEIRGNVSANLVQTCVATNADVPEQVDAEFSLLLLPKAEVEALDAEEAYMDPDAPEYDILETDTVDLAEIAVQTLAVMMDPYPRAEGVELDASHIKGLTVDEAPLKRPSPFSVLKEIQK